MTEKMKKELRELFGETLAGGVSLPPDVPTMMTRKNLTGLASETCWSLASFLVGNEEKDACQGRAFALGVEMGRRINEAHRLAGLPVAGTMQWPDVRREALAFITVARDALRTAVTADEAAHVAPRPPEAAKEPAAA